MATFINPQNGYTQSVSQTGAFFGCLLFGVLYFAYKGVWRHALISFAAVFLTFGISWLVYPFIAYRCVEQSYLERGWRRAGQRRVPTKTTGASWPSFDDIP